MTDFALIGAIMIESVGSGALGVIAEALPDMVNHPPHYTQGGVECIDAIRAALGREGFIMFLRGQVLKYQWRLGLKGDAAEDAAKANWYGRKLEEVLKE
jgi:hypothetical protein